MGLSLIIILAVVGIILILIEIFLIPGVGVAGVLGLSMMVASVVLAYGVSSLTGHLVFGGTVVSGACLTWLAFRSGTWERFALKDEVTARAKQEFNLPKSGDLGKCISRLAPAGTAEFGGESFEVHAFGEVVPPGASVVVTHVDDGRVMVKQV